MYGPKRNTLVYVGIRKCLLHGSPINALSMVPITHLAGW
jgi:catabolite regulation protein CreA